MIQKKEEQQIEELKYNLCKKKPDFLSLAFLISQII